MVGYHRREIEKGVVGELDKIYEEVEELQDAEEQGVELMVLLEMSDIIGAIELYLKNHHPTISLHDLLYMSYVTQRAFRSGHRK